MSARIWDGTGPVLADTSAWTERVLDGLREVPVDHLERLGEHLGIESHWISDPPQSNRGITPAR